MLSLGVRADGMSGFGFACFVSGCISYAIRLCVVLAAHRVNIDIVFLGLHMEWPGVVLLS